VTSLKTAAKDTKALVEENIKLGLVALNNSQSSPTIEKDSQYTRSKNPQLVFMLSLLSLFFKDVRAQKFPRTDFF